MTELITNKNITEFEFSDEQFSIFYDEDEFIWFAEHYDKDIFEDIIIIEDEKNNIVMDEEFELFGIYTLTMDHFKELKSVVGKK